MWLFNIKIDGTGTRPDFQCKSDNTNDFFVIIGDILSATEWYFSKAKVILKPYGFSDIVFAI